MWHSYLAVYYWNDPEVLTLPGPLFIFNIFLPSIYGSQSIIEGLAPSYCGPLSIFKGLLPSD